MRNWKIVLLLCWLAFVAAMFMGCDKPYLPGDFADALDSRIDELHRAKELYPAAECQSVLTKQLTFLEELQEASR